MEGLPRIVAVDFDGTLCEEKFPEIGSPKIQVMTALLEEQRNGSKIILWTCRHGKHLQEAVAWCLKYGIKFDAVNENLPKVIELFGGTDNRKIYADVYWDDKAFNVSEIENKPAACLSIYKKNPITKQIELKNKRILYNIKELLAIIDSKKVDWETFRLIIFKDNAGRIICPEFLKWYDRNTDQVMRWEEFSNGQSS